MISKSNLSPLNPLNSSLNLSGKKKRILFLTFLIITFLLSSTITYVPDSKASEIQYKFKPTSDKSLDHSMLPDKTEGLNKGKEGYLNGQERGLGLQPPPDNVELVGMWPYGPCNASAVDTTRDIALIGNGYTMQVLDISTPSSLSKIGEVTLEGNAQDITISGDYAYVVTLSSLKIVDISDLNSPNVVGSEHFEETPFEIRGGFQSIAFSSGYVYMAASPFNGLYIYDVSDPYNPTRQVHYCCKSITDVAIWGNYVICEYEVLSPDPPEEWRDIIEIFDVSTLKVIGEYMTEAGYGLSGIDVSDDGYVYSCQYSDTDETGKIAVIDVHDPENPVEVGSYVESGRRFEGITLSGNHAYLYERWRCLITMDVSNLKYPSKVGEYDAGWLYRDLDVSGSFAGVSRSDGFSLFDVSDPSNPSQLGDYDTPCRIGHANSIVVSGDYAYIANYLDGLRIMDISDPSNPFVAGICSEFHAGGGLAVSGRFAYCLYGLPHGRLYIVDISSPNSPFLLARLDFPSDTDVACEPWDIAVRENYAYVSGNKWISGEWGGWFLAVVDISNPLAPSIMGFYDRPIISRQNGIALSGNYAYLAVTDYSDVDVRRASLRIIDISDPTDPTEVGYYFSGDTSGDSCDDIAVRGNYAYMAGDRLRIIDILDPGSPKEISSSDLGRRNVALSGDYAYLGNLSIVDISDPENPYEAGHYYVEGEGRGVAVSGNYAYLPGSLRILKNLLAPQISIIDPSDWDIIHGSVSIEVLASHSSGIDRVDFYIDDSYEAADNTSPYTYTWDTTSVAEGSHKIRARAYNNNGKSSDSEIEVSIRTYRNLYIYPTSEGTADPATGTYSYDYGTEVSITAIPDSGYGFSSWTGDVPDGHENDNPVTITMDSDRSLTANFIKQYTLTISAGTGGTTDPAPGSDAYDEETEVSITAIPDTGYRFSGWTGNVPGGHENDNPVTVTMDSDKSVTANFVKQYTLTISAGNGGTTDPAPENYPCDEETEVSITAIPNSGYQFSGWSGDASGTATTITITMDSDKSVTANFSAIATDGDEAAAEKKKGPCFIATATYGSRLHSHVRVLRDLRDKYLIPTKLGRLLVELYYRYSPFVADLIAKHKALKVVVRVGLLPLVAFSYSLLHFGPIITAVMLLFIFGLPVFAILFFRRKMR